MINYNEGAVILIDKELSWTSFDVVKKIRNLVKAKTGHAGTLDPMATGLLILCTGKFTKRIEEFQGMEKLYEGTMKIGCITPSYDLETGETDQKPIGHVTGTMLEEAAAKFTGEIEQVPPAFSAVKVSGERAYEEARKGGEVKLQPRMVHIHDFTITGTDLPLVHFQVRCSKGTYIRALVRDFGREIGTGAYLTALRRTAIGDFNVADARTIRQFEEFHKQNPPV